MNQSFTRKAGYGALLAALAALSSVAVAQSAAPDTTLSSDGATARIQRGTVPLAPPAATTGSAAVTGDTANPATQGFTGGDAASSGASMGATTGTIATPGSSTSTTTTDTATTGAATADTATTGVGVDASGTIQPRAQGFIGAPPATTGTIDATPGAVGSDASGTVSPGTQGFTGSSAPATTSGANAGTQGSLGSDATIPATSGLAGSSTPATGDTVDAGTQGTAASDTPNAGSVGPDAQGFVGDTTTTENTGLGIWETGPGNVVAPPTGTPAASGLQAPPATTVP